MKQKHSFRRFLLILTGVLILLSLAALQTLYYFLEDYEATRESTALAQYAAAFQERFLNGGLLADYADSGTNPYTVPSETVRVVTEEMAQGYGFDRLTAESSLTQAVYALVAGGHVCGRVTFTQTVPMRFGLSGWECVSETFDFSHLQRGASVTVPAGYSVNCNGTPAVPGEFCEVRSVPVPAIEEAGLTELLGPDCPSFCEYTVSGVFGDIAFDVFDTAGVPVPEAERDEAHYLDNCSAEEKAAIDSLAAAFFDLYDNFGSAGNNPSGVYYRMLNYIVPDSDIDERLSGALYGLNWAITISTIRDIETGRYIRAADGVYVCDLSYTLGMRGYGGSYIEERSSCWLVMRDDGSGLRVSAMLDY